MNVIKTTAIVLGTIGVAGATAFSLDTKVSADTTNTLQVSNSSNSVNANQFLSSKIQMMNDSGGHSYGKWVYQYTAGPFALFRNSVTGAWRHAQIISTTNYTVSVIFDGVAQTFHL